ncbi:MAG TPA: carboxypeptidase-like regulatory domain-containing protein [Pyrinomonadaceae bacterium]|jgi:hypothetical protein
MKNLFAFIFALAVFAGGVTAGSAQVSSGGGFKLEQTVIAGGGSSNSTGGNFTIAGTIGQAAAGIRPGASGFNLQNGFWTAAPLAPTAAMVSITGRVLTATGSGIRNVQVTLTDGSGASRTILTSSFGYYRFDQITAGQTVILSVQAKRFTFAQPTVVLNVAEEMSEIDFTAAD